MEGIDLPISLTLALSGLGGACVFAMIQPDRESWLRSGASIAVGFLAALFTAPALCEWRGWESHPVQHATAFAIGLLGNPLCRVVLSEGTLAAVGAVKDAIKRVFGHGENGTPRPPRPRPDSD